MKVVFLDIDGVLNRVMGPLERPLVNRLNAITRATGAVIVVHSTWRYSWHLNKLRDRLFDDGVRGRVLDVCPTPPYVPHVAGALVQASAYDQWCEGMPSRDERAVAIQHWLNTHEVERFVILDDSDALGHFVGRSEFVQTRSSEGLTDAHVMRAIEVLHGSESEGARLVIVDESEIPY